MRFAAALAAALGGALFCVTALAGSIPDLGDGRVTDLTGTLDDGDIDDIESALADLEQDEGVDLFVLFVDSSGETDPATFTEQVASAEGLGGDDALLVVFIDDRVTQLFVSDSISDEISADEQDEAIDQANEQFAEGDFAAGIIAAGETLGDAASGDAGADGDGGGGGISFGTIALFLIIGAAVVLGGMWLFGLWQGERGQKRAAEEKDRQTGELAKRANTTLIETDEALREADQELGFAEAQFAEPDVQPFRAALEGAREELKAAFIVKQQLDDEQPEDADTRRKMLQQVLAHCDKALTGINQQKERLRQLRELEKNAPEVLSGLPAQIAGLRDRIDDARAVFERLKAYNARSWASVSGNGTEAEKRLVFAEGQVSEGESALTREDRSAAARAAREAQVATAGADELLDAIDHIEKLLHEAKTGLAAELNAAAGDIEKARRFLSSYEGGERRSYQARLGEAEKLLQSAETESRVESPDYLVAMKHARHANVTADEVLATAREETEKRERLQAAYNSALREAQGAYTIAQDYIGSRRKGIGNRPRTRLAEARRHLDTARGIGATEAGLKEAERAEELADQAYKDAREDFDDYDDRGGFRIGGFPILIGGGGWGGTRWGGTGGRTIGGGWGGGRSMGGSWGGGGRTRGGRW